MAYTHERILLSHKKKYEILPFATTWIDLGDFLDSSVGKESACNAEDPGSIPGSGRSTGEGIGYPLQYSGLENSVDCTVHGLQTVGHD